jgi:hypothetical protein
MLLPNDPRHLNSRFDLESIQAHVKGYTDVLSSALLPSIGASSTVRFRKLKPRAHAARGFGSLEMAGQTPSPTIFYAIGLRGHSPLRTPHSRSFARIRHLPPHSLRQRLWL